MMRIMLFLMEFLQFSKILQLQLVMFYICNFGISNFLPMVISLTYFYVIFKRR